MSRNTEGLVTAMAHDGVSHAPNHAAKRSIGLCQQYADGIAPVGNTKEEGETPPRETPIG